MSDEPKTGVLQPRAQVFVQHYLLTLNQTQAAIEAGYSRKSAASAGARLMGKPEVTAAIAEAMEQRAKRVGLDQDFVIRNLQTVVQRCLGQIKPIEKYDPELGRIAGTGEFTFDSHGAVKALELLGRHLGMFPKPTSPDEMQGNSAKSALVHVYIPHNGRDPLPEAQEDAEQDSAIDAHGREH